MSTKTAIVTGAASGIGRATVVRLVAEGANVLGVDLNAAGLAETTVLAQASAAHGGTVTTAICSVADEAAVKQVVIDFVARAGQLDVLVNMAGYLRSSHTTETSLQSFLDIIQVNLVGTFLFCREALPHLLKTQGNIVNAASTSAFFGHPYMAAYAASKHFVAALSEALAEELGPYGVLVSVVHPGTTRTPFLAGAGVVVGAQGVGRIADRLAMDPAVVAAAAIEGLYRGERRIVPGFTNRMHDLAQRVVPRRWLMRLFGRVARGE